MGTQMSRRGFIGAAAAGAAVLGAGLVGCGTTAKPAAKPVILVTSFGTSFNNSRHITIGAIESDVREAFPDYDVRRAFTAQIIIDHVESCDGRHIQNVEEALQSCADDGVKELVVLPTHLTAGAEYDDVLATLDQVKDNFDSIKVAKNLLASDADIDTMIAALETAMKPYDKDDTAVIFMGHGNTENDEATSTYNTIEAAMQKNHKNWFVCTVEGTGTTSRLLEDMPAAVEGKYKKAVLRPLMIVAGDHANNDMAAVDAEKGSDDYNESLRGMLENAGLDVTCVIEGLGQLWEIDEMYVAKVQEAIDGEPLA